MSKEIEEAYEGHYQSEGDYSVIIFSSTYQNISRLFFLFPASLLLISTIIQLVKHGELPLTNLFALLFLVLVFSFVWTRKCPQKIKFNDWELILEFKKATVTIPWNMISEIKLSSMSSSQVSMSIRYMDNIKNKESKIRFYFQNEYVDKNAKYSKLNIFLDTAEIKTRVVNKYGLSRKKKHQLISIFDPRTVTNHSSSQSASNKLLQRNALSISFNLKNIIATENDFFSYLFNILRPEMILLFNVEGHAVNDLIVNLLEFQRYKMTRCYIGEMANNSYDELVDFYIQHHTEADWHFVGFRKYNLSYITPFIDRDELIEFDFNDPYWEYITFSVHLNAQLKQVDIFCYDSDKFDDLIKYCKKNIRGSE